MPYVTSRIRRALLALLAALCALGALAPHASAGTFVTGITDEEEGANIVMGPDDASRAYPRDAELPLRTPALFVGSQPRSKTVNLVQFSKLHTTSACPWPVYVALNVYRYPAGSTEPAEPKQLVARSAFPVLVDNNQQQTRWLTEEPLDLQQGESYGFVATVTGSAWTIDPDDPEQVRLRDLCVNSPLRTTTYPAVDPPKPNDSACVRMPIRSDRPNGITVFSFYRVWMPLATETESAIRNRAWSTTDNENADRICRNRETASQTGGDGWAVVYLNESTDEWVSLHLDGVATQTAPGSPTQAEVRAQAEAPLCQQAFGEEQTKWGYGVLDVRRGQLFGSNQDGLYEAYVAHKCRWATFPPDPGGTDQRGWFWAFPNGPGLPGPDGSRTDASHQILDAELSSATSAPGLTDLRETLGGENPAAEVPRCNTADPINCATGNFYEEFTDLRLPGRGVGLSITRTYNAQAAVPATSGTAPQPGLFGRGWTSDFEAKLLLTGMPNSVVVQHGNGSTVPFRKVGNGWVGPEWARSTLARNGDSASAGFVYTLPDRTKYTFHPTTGALLIVADERSNRVVLTWSGARLTRLTGGGRTFTFAYNAAGRITSASDGTGRSVSYGYSTADELTSFTDVGGATSTYAYDLRGRMTRKTDPRGATVVNVYDANDRVTQQTDPLGRVTKLEYLGTPSGSKVKVTDRSGVVTLKVFTNGVPVSETRGFGTAKAATVRMAHTATGQLRRLTDARGFVTKYRYDDRGNRVEVEDALGGITKTRYDSSDRPIETISPAGRRTTITYDAVGNVRSSVRDSATITDGREERSFSYDAYGQLLTATDPGGAITTYTYDAVGNQTKVVTPGGRTTTVAYDARGNVQTTTLPAGNVTGATVAAHQITITRDLYGAPLTVKDASGAVTTNTYDNVGNLIGVKDADNRTTTFTYDLLHRKTSQVRPDGGVDSWTYTPEGEVLARTDGNGSVWTNAYDEMGRRVSQSDPFGNVTTYTYAPTGNLARVTAPDGGSVAYVYDEIGRLALVSPNGPGTLRAEAPEARFEYDRDGLVTQAENGVESSTRTWDALGRMTERSFAAGSDGRDDQGIVSLRYDAAGNVRSVRYPTGVEHPKSPGERATADFGTVTYTYGPDGEMAGATGLSGGQYSFVYDANGNLTRANYPGGRTALYARDVMGRPVTILTPAGRRNYTYSAAGVRKTLGIDGATTTLLTDGSRHLTGFGTKSYTFDAGENVTQMYDGATPVRQAFAGPQLRFTETAADAKLTYRHDVLGRRIRETEPNTDYSTFTWNELSQLKWATFRTRTGTYSRRDFAYGPTGLRQSVTREGVVKLEAWEEALGSNAPMLTQGLDAVVYGPGGMLLERVGANGSNPRYQWQDAIGTVIGGTSSSGATTRLSYDAWGRRVSGNDTLVGSQGFAGQVMESETDYSYMRARWYDAQTGLFLTVDPKVDETRQPYLYAGGNPAQYTDPSGESFGEDFANGMIQGLSNGLIKPGSNEGSCSWGYFMGLQAGENFNPLGKAKKLEELLGFAKIGGKLSAGPSFAEGQLAKHFEKHAAEFGYKSQFEYLAGAWDLIERKGVKTFERPGGDRLFYDAARNEFAIVSSDGVLRTFFRPERGGEYWQKQVSS